jgi:hypothetical protein
MDAKGFSVLEINKYLCYFPSQEIMFWAVTTPDFRFTYLFPQLNDRKITFTEAINDLIPSKSSFTTLKLYDVM